jgi:superfamily II DNA or RNA helicase
MVTIDYIPGKRKGQIRCDKTILEMIRNHFSVVNPDKQYCKDPRKKRFLPDRKSAITATGLFEFGLYYEIRKYLIKEQITDITFTENFKNRLKCGIDKEFINDLKFDERYFQKESVQKGLKVGCGIFLIATGGGKSFCQALLIDNYRKNVHNGCFKTLIIVPGLSLVEQLQGDFKDYGASFSYSGWSGDNPLQETDVVICNAQNLIAKFDENPWIVDVDLLIVDECHGTKESTVLSKIIQKIKTPNRYGFTGTLPKTPLDEWEILGTYGPVFYEKKSKELRDEGFLSDVEIIRICLKKQRPRKIPYKEELNFLYHDDDRNNMILKLLSKMTKNTLLMVNHHDQMDQLYDRMKNLSSFQVFKVTGETPVEEREEVRKIMERDDNVICLAMSSIFSTGINIKNIHNIFFVALGKSFVRTVQSIGRGLRLHEDKSKLRIYDIYDNMKYSESHAEERKMIYEEQEIRIIEKEILI